MSTPVGSDTVVDRERTHDEQVDADEQPFLSHLLELRARILRSLLVVFVSFFPVYYFSDEIFDFVTGPMRDALPGDMIATQVASPFLTPLKLCLYVTVFITIPYVLHQVWGFREAGPVPAREALRRPPLLVSSTVLFYLGMAFAYYVVFPLAFVFFAGAGQTLTGVTPDHRHQPIPRLRADAVLRVRRGVRDSGRHGAAGQDWLGVFAQHGAQAPVRDRRLFRDWHAADAPPDIITQFMLALPAWLLFEFGIILARMVEKPREEEEEENEEEANQQ